ncbi:MAG: NAD(P)/FAD-dependent oxidoreductase [candidate division WOR-3 bacterium]
MKKIKVAIIGAGPAGIACAIQLKRYKIDFVIFERNEPGGLLRNAYLVENYPGFPEGIKGEKLVSLFCKQLEVNRITPVYEDVKNVIYDKNFVIKTNNRLYQSKILVIASGTMPKKFDITLPPDSESKIFYEIVHLKTTGNATIAIIGAGDAAFDYALSLCQRNKVYLLNRTRIHKCLPLLFQKAMKNKNIKYVKEFELVTIQLKNKKLVLHSKNKELISVDYLVVAIGREPNLDFLDKKLEIEILEKNKKLYMIGDVKNGLFRQTAIAVGEGIKTAMEISMGDS